jgi:hypothetical protein
MTKFRLVATLALASLAFTAAADSPKMKMTTDIPASIITPDSVETRLGTLNFFDGYPDDATTELVYDNLDFMNGVQAFLSAMPGASAEGFRTGWATQGADNNQTLIIMENLMDSKSLYLTPNTESIYHMVWFDKTWIPGDLEVVK